MDISIKGLPKEFIICDRIYISSDFEEDIWIRPVKEGVDPIIKIGKEINSHDQIIINLYFQTEHYKNYYVPSKRLKENGLNFILNELISANI